MKRIVVIPVFNEEKSLSAVLSKLDNFDVRIVVNDGSTDNSHSLIEEWRHNKPDTYYLNFTTNQKKSTAQLHAFYFINFLFSEKRVNGEDVVMTIDADGQHDFNQVEKAFDFFVENDTDYLITKRDFSKYPAYKVLGNRLMSWVAGLTAGYRFFDVESGFRLVRVTALRQIIPYITGRRYSIEQESSIIAALLKIKINNRFPIDIVHYRSRTSFVDALINMTLGFAAFLRVRLRIQKDFGKSELFRQLLNEKYAETDER